MDEFVPRHVTLKTIKLLSKCKCERSQKEMKKLENKLFKKEPIKEFLLIEAERSNYGTYDM